MAGVGPERMGAGAAHKRQTGDPSGLRRLPTYRHA